MDRRAGTVQFWVNRTWNLQNTFTKVNTFHFHFRKYLLYYLLFLWVGINKKTNFRKKYFNSFDGDSSYIFRVDWRRKLYKLCDFQRYDLKTRKIIVNLTNVFLFDSGFFEIKRRNKNVLVEHFVELI